MEEHQAPPRLRADVAVAMHDAGRDVDRLAGTQERALTGDVHRELAFNDVNRLGLTQVAMRRQRPPHRRLIDQQTQRAGRALRVQMNLGAHNAGHPDHLAAHTPMIADRDIRDLPSPIAGRAAAASRFFLQEVAETDVAALTVGLPELDLVGL